MCGLIHLRDHHCVWINQCVGSHNQRAFVAFIVSLSSLSFLYAYMIASAMAQNEQQTITRYLTTLLSAWDLPMPMAGAVYAFAAGMFTSALSFGQALSISTGLTAYEKTHFA